MNRNNSSTVYSDFMPTLHCLGSTKREYNSKKQWLTILRCYCFFRAAVIFFTVVFTFFAFIQETQAIEQKNYNVILIVVDGLRADHLGCYGYPRKTSANIDILAEQGVLFLDVMSQATWTLPSFSSFLTSRDIMQHHVINDTNFLPDSELTLAEVLKIFGYRTAAFVSNVHLNKRFNLSQGFDTYEDVPYEKGIQGDHWPLPTISIEERLPSIMQWLEDHQHEKTFLMFHINDAHSPFHFSSTIDENVFDPFYKGVVDGLTLDLPLRKNTWGYLLCKDNKEQAPLNKKDIEHIIAHYDARIFHADAYIGRFIKFLKDKDLMQKTIIILTADHGVDLFDHGTLFNYPLQMPPYQEVTHIPLIIVYPDQRSKGNKVTGVAMSIDILPTILDCLNIPPKIDAQGKSLKPFFEGQDAIPERFTYSFSSDAKGVEHSNSSTRKKLKVWNCSYAVRWGDWKLMAGFFKPECPVFTLYDLKSDPREFYNRICEDSDIRSKLLIEFRRWYAP